MLMVSEDGGCFLGVKTMYMCIIIHFCSIFVLFKFWMVSAIASTSLFCYTLVCFCQSKKNTVSLWQRPMSLSAGRSCD